MRLVQFKHCDLSWCPSTDYQNHTFITHFSGKETRGIEQLLKCVQKL